MEHEPFQHEHHELRRRGTGTGQKVELGNCHALVVCALDSLHP